MADMNIQLLDTGENFILISDDTETEIEYGQLAVSLINSNYNDMYRLFSDFLQSNRTLRLSMDLQNSNNDKLANGTIKPEFLNVIIRPLYKPIFNYLSKEYLTPEQATVISLLLMSDIRSRFTNTMIDLNKPEYYIPLVYSDMELHQHIKNVLLEKDFSYLSPLQDKINQVQLTSSVIITKYGQTYQSYVITDIIDYLILDLHKYLNGDKKVNECACCNKLFYPKYRRSEKYCYFNNSACKEKMKRTQRDEFAIYRDSSRAYQNGRISSLSTQKKYPRTPQNDFLRDIYDEWSEECTQKYNEYKSNNDFEGFKDWFESTKFYADRLQEKYEKWKLQHPTP